MYIIVIMMIYFIAQGIIEGQHWSKPKVYSAFNIDYHSWRLLEVFTIWIGFFIAYLFILDINSISIDILPPFIGFVGYGLLGNYVYEKFLKKVSKGSFFNLSTSRDYFLIFNYKFFFNKNRFIKLFHKYIYELSLILSIIFIIIGELYV